MSKFRPDWAVPPGATIEEWLEEVNMTQVELASRVGLSAKALNQIIRGHAPLTQETALRLEVVTDVPAATWNRLEAQWQAESQRLKRSASLSEATDWVKQFPLEWLRKNGVITATGHDRVGQVEQVLMFFRVATPDAWEKTWSKPAAAFRQSSAHEVQAPAVASWLRLGEVYAEKIDCAPFDAAALRAQLPDLRRLSLQDPERYGQELIARCARVGVALVFLPEPAGARCSGAARWFRTKYIVQLSLRYKSDDHLWFSLFHELGHVLLHDRSEIFIEGLSSGPEADAKEEQADTFARRLLIPDEYVSRLNQLRSLSSMVAFAQEIGVAPGIVVGRLQRERKDFSFGNSLKKRLAFA